jgi:beta-glucosidase
MVWRKDLTKVPFEYNLHLIITIRVVERRAGLETVEAAGYGRTGEVDSLQTCQLRGTVDRGEE